MLVHALKETEQRSELRRGVGTVDQVVSEQLSEESVWLGDHGDNKELSLQRFELKFQTEGRPGAEV